MVDQQIDRQNILNNTPALRLVESYLALPWREQEWQLRFTLKQVAEYYDVDEKTIKRYLDTNSDELKKNGYEVWTGKRLADAKNTLARDMDVPTKTTILWVFSFRAFLNIWLLLSDSERAKELRVTVLNIVMDYINQRAGGNTKYINQNDETFLETYKDSLYYRKKFTDSLRDFVQWWANKYPYFTNLVYEAIFMENAKEYKALLKLWDKENVRHTLYTEVLNLVSAYENGFAAELEKNWVCDFWKAKEIFDVFRASPVLEPLVQNARKLMSTRDKALRDVLHDTMLPYIQSLSPEEYEKFCREHAELIGEKSQEFVSIMDENTDVLLRLRDK